jgi:anti-anti-sigma regulatory factor
LRLFMNGSMGQLRGNLTDSEVTGGCIDALSDSLQQIEAGGARNIRIDCARVHRADPEGLRLLYTWIQCARFRGVELELVNLSDCLQQVMMRCGLGCFFTAQDA